MHNENMHLYGPILNELQTVATNSSVGALSKEME